MLDYLTTDTSVAKCKFFLVFVVDFCSRWNLSITLMKAYQSFLYLAICIWLVLKLTHLSLDNVLKRAEELKSQNLDLRGSKSLLFSFPCRKSIQFAESWQLVVCIGNELQFHFLLQDKFVFIGIINLIDYSILTFKQYSAGVE